jgi:hypothetical protein
LGDYDRGSAASLRQSAADPRCYERTRDQGTLGSIAIAIVEPLGGHLFMYLVGHVRSYLGVEVHQPTSRDGSLGIPLGIQGGSIYTKILYKTRSSPIR